MRRVAKAGVGRGTRAKKGVVPELFRQWEGNEFRVRPKDHHVKERPQSHDDDERQLRRSNI